MYADKRLDCKAICLLAKGIIVYCKKLGVPPKGTAKARLKSASLMRQQSKLEVQLDNSHWQEIYDARSNSVGWVLRKNVRWPLEPADQIAESHFYKTNSLKGKVSIMSLTKEGLDQLDRMTSQ